MLNKQPSGLYILFFAEMWERFSYWGIQSLLVLYLINVFLFSEPQAYSTYGAYTALTFATSILGGLLADRLLGFRLSIIVGGVFILIGNIILALPYSQLIFLGLSFIINGTGLFKPNSASLLGTLYEKGDARRDSGFTLYYVGTNIGGLLGPVLYGFIATRYGWHTGFILSTIGMGIGLLVYYFKRTYFADKGLSPIPQTLNKKLSGKIPISYLLYLILLISTGLLSVLLQYPHWVGGLLDSIGTIILLMLITIAWYGNTIDRKRILALMLMIFFCLCFFAFVFQISTSLTLFTDHYVDRTFFSWKIPTEMFVALEPFFVVITAPALAQLWLLLGRYEPSTPFKIVIGLFLGGLAFLIFYLAAKIAINFSICSMFWLILGNFFLGLGELCIAPPVISAITLLAPTKLKGTMIGIFYLSLAFASYLSGFIARFTTSGTSKSIITTSANNYAVGFSYLCCLAFFIAILGLFIAWINRKQYCKVLKELN